MKFILTGFTQDMGFRVFAFEGIGDDQSRTAYTVRSDLALSRRYEIRMQDLPLLCRLLLERRGEVDETHAYIFTEDEMSAHAKECATARRAPLFRKKRGDANVPAVSQPEQ